MKDNVLRGIALLARGNSAGMAEFPDSINGLYASLGPLIAFPLVGAGLLAYSGQPALAAIAFLSRLSVVLALSVLIHACAQFTRREALWLRTAIALNWSFWLVIPLLFAAALIGAVLVTAGVAEPTAQYAVIGIMAVYLLWCNWFIIRAGLQLASLPAFGVMLLTNGVLGLLTLGPTLLSLLLRHR
jgi:hypothetical protein